MKISNGSAIRDPRIEILRIKIMRTVCNARTNRKPCWQRPCHVGRFARTRRKGRLRSRAFRSPFGGPGGRPLARARAPNALMASHGGSFQEEYAGLPAAKSVSTKSVVLCLAGRENARAVLAAQAIARFGRYQTGADERMHRRVGTPDKIHM